MPYHQMQHFAAHSLSSPVLLLSQFRLREAEMQEVKDGSSVSDQWRRSLTAASIHLEIIVLCIDACLCEDFNFCFGVDL